MAEVTLRAVTDDNFDQVVELQVADAQEQFVAPNERSLAQAAVTTEVMFRAIYAGDDPVGFLMLSTKPDRFYLWRYMIDERHQVKGYGKAAMELVIEHTRQQPNVTELYLSYVPGQGSPEGFYKSLGFVDTGVVQDGETEAVLQL